MCNVKLEIKFVFCVIIRVIFLNYNLNNIVYEIKGGKFVVIISLFKEKDYYNVEVVFRVK